jgi:hypothetical protein
MVESKSYGVRIDPVTGQKLYLAFEEREAPSHPHARALLDYWNEICRSGDFVMGRDVPARTISKLMKHLTVFEPTDGDFRLRLVGDLIRQKYGYDATGMLVSEVYDPVAGQQFVSLLSNVVARGRPVVQDVRLRGVLDDIYRADLLLLPVKAPDREATWVLDGTFYW